MKIITNNKYEFEQFYDWIKVNFIFIQKIFITYIKWLQHVYSTVNFPTSDRTVNLKVNTTLANQLFRFYVRNTGSLSFNALIQECVIKKVR